MYDLTYTRLRLAAAQLPVIWKTLVLIFRASGSLTSLWLVALAVTGTIPAAIVYMSRPFIDGLAAVVNRTGSIEAVLWYLGVLIGLVLLAEVLRVFTHYLGQRQAEYVEDYITGLVHEKSASVALQFYDSPEYHNQLFRVQEEGGNRPLAVLESCGALLQSGVTLLGVLLVLLPYGWWLPIALIVGSLPLVWVLLTHKYLQYRYRLQHTEDERRSWYYDFLLTRRECASELRFFFLGQLFKNCYQNIRRSLRDGQLSLLKKEAIAELCAVIFGFAVIGSVLAWMVWQTLQGIITLGVLALVYQAFSQAQRVSHALLRSFGELYGNMFYLSELFTFFELPASESTVAELNILPETHPATLELRKVSFHYPGQENPILNDVNFRIERGEIVAIIGENGSGKSTLVKLLSRLHEPTAGEILVNGRNIAGQELQSFRHSISVMFQDSVRYNDSLKNSIMFGDSGIENEERYRNALITSGVSDMLASLPDGEKSILGKAFVGGVELSAGQWQRIALARALYRQASMLILDEPTSLMDPWMEREWLSNLRSIAPGKSIILVTHRPALAEIADRVLMLRAGALVPAHSDELKRLDRSA